MKTHTVPILAFQKKSRQEAGNHSPGSKKHHPPKAASKNHANEPAAKPEGQ